ncbi:hypothetical protein CEXT_472011 [Caerostris extrusa]|uniref:Ycf15 n=1 Tax=Caerostris extrusa TaxID=172846 RepID=A0AAV4T766_CAEEX|nr:hypothetical protein CEXT_472011 [Caerostris extrusa]
MGVLKEQKILKQVYRLHCPLKKSPHFVGANSHTIYSDTKRKKICNSSPIFLFAEHPRKQANNKRLIDTDRSMEYVSRPPLISGSTLPEGRS